MSSYAFFNLEKKGREDADGAFSCVDLGSANKIVGITTEEIVSKTKEGDATTTWYHNYT